jgi:hypothetical protein
MFGFAVSVMAGALPDCSFSFASACAVQGMLTETENMHTGRQQNSESEKRPAVLFFIMAHPVWN